MPRDTHIGAYRILRLINQGGQGTVLLGYDDRLRRRVAIKIYRLPRDKALRREILREAQIVASIQSPKIVQIYDLVVANDHVALIMEYVSGCDLEEFLAHGTPSLASILTICTDVSAALAVARQQHIIHGDLKAGNILVTRQGRVKLTDFGIARHRDGQDSGTNSTASISCVSPEQYLGQTLDIRSDLFALGCLLYRMLTGKHPFVQNEQLIPGRLLQSNPQTVEELIPKTMALPPGLSELLASLLQKDPQKRPNNTHQVRSSLRKISRQIPLSVGNTLLREAESFFRPESKEEIPPQVPSDLTRNGRSTLGRPRYIPEFLANMSHLALGGVLLGLVVTGVLVQFIFQSELRIVIERPSFVIATDADLPPGLSPRWMAAEIERGLYQQLESVVVLGREPERAFVSPDLTRGSAEKMPRTDLYLSPELHCVDDVCLLDLILEVGGETFSQQKLIFSSMSISQWSNRVQAATRALLEQRS